MADSFAAPILNPVDKTLSVTRSTPTQMLDPQRWQRLVGKSINPAIADRFLSKVDFDHLGRIVDIKQGAALKLKDLGKLEKGVMERHLTQTNVQGSRDVARTEREILLDACGQLERARASTPPELHPKIDVAMRTIKDHWLNFHTGHFDSTSGLLNYLDRLLRQDLPTFSAAVKALAKEASQPKELTQLYDNTFGRQFESALVHELVKHPPPAVVDAALQTGDYLWRRFARLPLQKQAQCLQGLVLDVTKDSRPWHAETPDVARFLAQPDLAHLEAMLKPAEPKGYDVIKISWISVYVSCSLHESRSVPWMIQANDNYANIVTPARSSQHALGGMGNKFQTVAALEIQMALSEMIKSRNKVAAPLKSADADADAKVDALHAMLRSLFDPISFSANTPAKLVAAIDEMVQLLELKDTQPADFFKFHRNRLAAMPDQDAEFEMVHSRLDTIDKKQVQDHGPHFTPHQTSGYGTALAHQPKLIGGEHWGEGVSIQGRTTLDMDNIKAFDANALNHEMNSVVGPSGFTNIMTFLYLQMHKENQLFNVQDAFAGTMMLLTLDGGHSLPESVATFRSITSDTRPTMVKGQPVAEHDQIMANRRQVLETNELAYGQLSLMFDSPSTANAVQSAVDRAWDRTRQTFDEIHAQRIMGSTL